MPFALRRALRAIPTLVAALCLSAAPAHALALYAFSGNTAAGNPDPIFRRLDLATSCGIGAAAAFTAADFAAANSAPPAVRLSYIHPAWGTSIPCEPNASWIGVDALATPRSALYSVDFNVPAQCCFTAAYLDFCWLVDDALGDAINPAGIYLNGFPIPAVAGGNYSTETAMGGIDVTPYVKCGVNTLYIYDRDLGCAVSGVMIGAMLQINECVTPTEGTSWGSVKATYR